MFKLLCHSFLFFINKKIKMILLTIFFYNLESIFCKLLISWYFWSSHIKVMKIFLRGTRWKCSFSNWKRIFGLASIEPFDALYIRLLTIVNPWTIHNNIRTNISLLKNYYYKVELQVIIFKIILLKKSIKYIIALR
jgi:hypothetical protein